MSKKTNGFQLLGNLDVMIAGIALIVLVVCTFMGVVMRYFFNNPFVWLQEVQLWCFTWVVFFGGGAAFRSGSHVAIEVIVDRMPVKLKKLVEVLGYIIVMAILAYFMVYGTKLVMQLWRTGRTTNILDVPFPIIYGAFPLGCGLMMINHTVMTWQYFFQKEEKGEGVLANGN